MSTPATPDFSLEITTCAAAEYQLRRALADERKRIGDAALANTAAELRAAVAIARAASRSQGGAA